MYIGVLHSFYQVTLLPSLLMLKINIKMYIKTNNNYVGKVNKLLHVLYKHSNTHTDTHTCTYTTYD